MAGTTPVSPRTPRSDHPREALAPDRGWNAGLIAATVTAVAALLVLGARSGRSNWPVYLVVVLVGAVTAVTVQARHPLSRTTRVGLSLFAVGHVAGGMVPIGSGVLYGVWLWQPVVRYDNVQHAWGFGIVGRATWEVLRGRLPPARHDPGLVAWVVVLAATAVGSVNEVVEWVMTLTIPGTDVGGYDNTARDLVANLVGGVLVGWWTARRPPRSPVE